MKIVDFWKKILYDRNMTIDREAVRVITSLNVANSVLDRAYSQGIKVSAMKLQKIIYFIYKKYYELKGEPLFSERFEAWPYGPVLPVV